MHLNKMKVLSNGEVQNIVQATTRILEETGVKIDSESTLLLLKERGLPVDIDNGIVRFPHKVQEKCIASAPTIIPVINRNGDMVFTIGDGNSYFASGHNAVFFDDIVSGEHRQFTLEDVHNYVAISHHLEDIDMIGLPASPSGVESRSSLLYALRSAFIHSDKPVYFSTDSEVINHFAIDMTHKVMGSDLEKGAYMISQLSPTSPLFWEKGAVEGIVECAERKFPVAILPEPITGVTAPYSLAGLITVHNAEALSGICIAQLINPGTPVIWASSWTTFDMKKSAALVGSVETTLCRIAGAQVAKHYNLPLHTTAPNSDNHAHDEQNSWEKTLSLFCAAAAGNDLIVNLGMYACGLTISLEQLVMDAEIVGQTRRLLKGIEASPDMIAEDIIKEVGQRGEYIMHNHTINLLATGEHREPLVAARGSIDTWKEKGGNDATMMAHSVVQELLQEPVPTINENTIKALNEILEEAVEIR